MIQNPLDVVRAVASPLRGKAVLDVGCGEGGFAALLANEGADVVGLDPNAEAVARARAAVPAARFDQGVAEALPYDGRSFDAVVFVNALHHVPVPAMAEALREAARVLRPDGALIVIEPLPSGSFFAALRLAEDETVVRLAAQDAVAQAVAAGHLRSLRTISYVRHDIYDDADRFLDRIVAVDPNRKAAVEANRADISRAVRKVAALTAEGKLALDQPIRADILGPGNTFAARAGAL